MSKGGRDRGGNLERHFIQGASAQKQKPGSPPILGGAGVVNPIGSRIAGFLLMKCLHQGDGADDALNFKLPLGPAGPVYALGLWCVPFLGSACGIPTEVGTGTHQCPPT